MNETLAAGAPPRLASARAILGTLAATIAAFIVMLALDLSLAKIERIERASHATSLYTEGNGALAAGRIDDAVDRLSSALALERDSATYAVALSRAILARGQPAQAEATLLPRLESDPTDGALNLAMARVVLKAGRVDEAISYYHRAIYGRWNADPTLNRNQARSELIDVLARAQRKEELLAELLPLQDASSDTAFQKKLGGLFLVAGSPARAAVMFRAVLGAAPHDADSYAGLGEASLMRGNFRTARANLRLADRERPADDRIDSLLTLADTVVSLDPDDVRAGAGEAYARSLNFLHRTINSVTACEGTQQIAGIRMAADSAAVLDHTRAPATATEARVDANLALSEQVWKLRPISCPLASFGDQALALIHSALVQR